MIFLGYFAHNYELGIKGYKKKVKKGQLSIAKAVNVQVKPKHCLGGQVIYEVAAQRNACEQSRHQIYVGPDVKCPLSKQSLLPNFVK